MEHLHRAPAGRTGLDAPVILIEGIRDQYRRDLRSLRVLDALMFDANGPSEELRARFADFHRSMCVDIAATIRRGVADRSILGGIRTA